MASRWAVAIKSVLTKAKFMTQYRIILETVASKSHAPSAFKATEWEDLECLEEGVFWYRYYRRFVYEDQANQRCDDLAIVLVPAFEQQELGNIYMTVCKEGQELSVLSPPPNFIFPSPTTFSRTTYNMALTHGKLLLEHSWSKQAEQHFSKTLALIETVGKNWGDIDFQTVTVLYHLGESLLQQEKWQEAEQTLLRGLQVKQEWDEVVRDQRIGLNIQLSILHEHWGNINQAKQYERAAILLESGGAFSS